MPILIRELHIKMTVGEDPIRSPGGEVSNKKGHFPSIGNTDEFEHKNEIIEECVEAVLMILKRETGP